MSKSVEKNFKIAEAFWIHRTLRIRPGYVPVWLAARDPCAGFDVTIPLTLGPVFLTIFLPVLFREIIGIAALALWLPLLGAWLTILSRFHDRKRCGTSAARRMRMVRVREHNRRLGLLELPSHHLEGSAVDSLPPIQRRSQ